MGATTNVQVIIDAKDNASAVLKKTGAEISSVGGAFKDAQAGSFLFAAGLTAVATAIGAFAGFGTKVAADLETARQGFKTLLNSADLADQAIEQIKKDAKTTPFEIAGLVNANLLLTQVTKNAPRSEELLLNVGKALAASGKGQAELDRIIVNLQQIGNTAKITEMDVRQFGMAGINILEMLADYYGVTKAEASEMVKNSKDAFADLEGAFEKAGTGSGKFAKAYTEQTGTFNQLMSNVKDSVAIAAAEIMKSSGAFDAIKGAMAEFIKAMEKFTPKAVEGIKGFMEFMSKYGLVVAGAIIGALVPALYALASGFIAVMIPLLPFIAIGAAIGLVITGIILVIKNWGAIMAWLQGVMNVVVTALKDAWSSLVTKATEIKDGIVNKFIEIKDGISNAITTAIGWVVSKLEEGKALIISAVNAIKAGFDIFIAGLMALPALIAKFFIEDIPYAVGFAFGVLEKFFTVDVPAAWTMLVTFFTEQVPMFIAQFIAWITDLVVRTAQAIWNWATVTVPEAIRSLIQWATIEIPKFAAQFVLWIVTMATNAWNAIVKWKDDMIATLIQFKENAIAKIIELYNSFTAWIRQLITDVMSGINSMPGRISEAMQRVKEAAINKAREIYEGVKEWFDKIVGFFGDIIGKAGEAINKAKEAFNIGRQAGYSKQTGGIVPGAIGTPVPILAHAGERVTPAGLSGSSGGTGGLSFNVSIGLYAGTETEKRNIAKELYGALLQIAQSQNKTVVELMGG